MDLGIWICLLSLWTGFLWPSVGTGVPREAQGVHDLTGYRPQTSVIKHISTSHKWIALTFDDGPSQTFTPEILQLLETYHAKATFFVIGSRADKFPNLIRKEVAMHHEVANHTYSHALVTANSPTQIHRELDQAEHAISHVTGDSPNHLFRPPRGRYDEKVIRIATDDGYKIVLWSVDSNDWANPGTEVIVRRILGHVKSGDILLFHDQGGNRQQTVDALLTILPALQRQGYQFVTVSELLSEAAAEHGQLPAM